MNIILIGLNILEYRHRLTKLYRCVFMEHTFSMYVCTYYDWPSSFPNTLHGLAHFMLKQTSQGGYRYYPCFTGEKLKHSSESN